jgi:septum formation protein
MSLFFYIIKLSDTLLLNFPKHLYLASRSPRRASLLKKLNINFTIKNSKIDENIYQDLDPEKHVKILSFLKAVAITKKVKNGIILGADTIVALDKRILGKPKNAEDAKVILKMLSGKTHKVFTGFTLIDLPSKYTVTDLEITEVKFRKLSNIEIDNYIRTGSPLDKAGAYGIQDEYGSLFVESIKGCYYNVVGFPISKFYTVADKFINKINSNVDIT